MTSVATLVFTLSDLFAQPLGTVLSPDVVADYVVTDPQGRSFALSAVAAAAVATVCLGLGTARWARAALLLTVAGLLPPAFTGHSSAASNHDAAVISLALHLVGVAVWVGGLLFVLVAAFRREEQTKDAVRRFSPLAGWSLLAVGASGLVNAAVRLPSPSEVLTSRYGLLLLAKTAALLLLGVAGWWHRKRTMPSLAEGSGGASSASPPLNC